MWRFGGAKIAIGGGRSGKSRGDIAFAFESRVTDEDTRTDRPQPRTAQSVRRPCQPHPVTNNSPIPPGTLADIAAEISTQLRVAGFGVEGAVDRNILCLAEEVGEVVGAFRRYTGQARRAGTLDDVAEELADVVITGYVTAHEIGMDLDVYGWALEAPSAVLFLTPERWVRELYVRTGRFVTNFVDRCAATSPAVERDLANVVAGAYAVALALNIDLDAAIREKLTVVFTRGWREVGDRS